jgi:hypothetical protein
VGKVTCLPGAMDGELMKTSVNASAMIAKSLISETALKKEAANQQQFCFSRDFDSKRGAGVCQVASGFSFLEHFW